MASIKTDEGQDHELVLGNKQLLSAFFIVVVLLGVFFTMGYIIGRNTTPVPVAADAGAKPADAQADRPSQGIAPDAPGASEPDTAALAPPNPPSQEVLTQQAKPYDEPQGASAGLNRPEQPVAKPLVKPVVKPPAPEKATAPLEGRKYLQVMAVKRPDAEKVQKILGGQGFPTTLRQSSKEGSFRVLVGPYQDRPSLSKAKDDLKSAGFDAIVAR
ncbi:MAG: SPOR domain-containing protein [Acidobacteriota bacterium]|nr:SPOR domain-containing protein [Acidobacteriota bacterium]